VENNINNICASYQQSIVTFLLKKLERAAIQQGIQNIGIAGGVAANATLRKALQQLAGQNNWQTFIPAQAYCTDNAAMINQVAYRLYEKGRFAVLESIPYAR